MGLEMEGAMQQAAQLGRQSIAGVGFVTTLAIPDRGAKSKGLDCLKNR